MLGIGWLIVSLILVPYRLVRLSWALLKLTPHSKTLFRYIRGEVKEKRENRDRILHPEKYKVVD
jgi:hypothetical protein